MDVADHNLCVSFSVLPLQSIKAAGNDFRNPLPEDRKTLARLAKRREKMDDAGSFTGQAMPKDLPKIAWLSPFPPQKSGIANYSYWLTKALQAHFCIDLYYDDEPPSEAIRNEFNVYPLSVFARQRESYDEVIYHLGNHTGFHKEIYKLAWNYPGTVVLHDYNINAFMHDAFYCQNEEQFYKQALLEGYGDEGLEEFQALTGGRSLDTARFPLSHAVVGRSRKVIVHHRWVKNQFANNLHIEVVPLLAKLDHRPSVEELKLFKKKLSI